MLDRFTDTDHENSLFVCYFLLSNRIQPFIDERLHLMVHLRHNHRVALQFVHDGCWQHVAIDLSFVGDVVETVAIHCCMDVGECCKSKEKSTV